MKKTLSTFALLLIPGVGAYLYAMNNQISDIEEVCSLFPEGTAVGDLKQLEKKYSVQLMGPFTDQDKSGTQRAIFCATLTMCDTSCNVEFRENRVIKAAVWKL